MKKSRTLLIYFTLQAIFTLIVSNVKAQTQGIKLKDEVRRMTLFVPEGIDKTTPSALIISLHGSGTTALEHMFYTEMNEMAKKEKVIIAYPQGNNNDWNVGFEQDFDSGNDVEFIDSLVQKIKKHYSIKENEVFAVGLSRGGFFAQRLASELPNTFAAIASIGAPLSDLVFEQMPKNLSTGFLLAHGTADQMVSYEGKQGHYFSAESSIAEWVSRNQIAERTSIHAINSVDDGTRITIHEFEGTKSVMLLKIENGGHTWPGADDFNIGFPLGLTTHDIDFNTFLWNFFQMNVTEQK